MQLVCRDRNRLALQAEIAGAALHGIENICCLTGDDVTAGDEPEARRVFDLDSIQLLATAEAMRNGRYLSGRKLDPAPHLFLGAVENPAGAAARPPRRPRAQEGARRRALPPAAGRRSSSAPLDAFMTRGGRDGLAERRRDPAVDLPRALADAHCASSTRTCRASPCRADLIERCERAADPEAECFEVACELADAARSLPGVRGLHLISFPQGGGYRTPVQPPRHPHPSRKGTEWKRFSSRRLRPS